MTRVSNEERKNLVRGSEMTRVSNEERKNLSEVVR